MVGHSASASASDEEESKANGEPSPVAIDPTHDHAAQTAFLRMGDASEGSDQDVMESSAQCQEDQFEQGSQIVEKGNLTQHSKECHRRNQRFAKSKEKENSSLTSRQQKRKRKGNKLFQDCVSVEIPLDYTADLAIALRHTRNKRIAALQEAYPCLFRKITKMETPVGDPGIAGDSNTSLNEDEGETAGDDSGDKSTRDQQLPPRKKKSAGMPDRNNYSNILDYLEAKYVKGVMIDNDGVDGEDEDDEDKGSIYSETSFLDDEDLKRDVAEQVLAQTTTTMHELQQKDSQFFVNVGNLEVQETEQTKDHYDPLQDVDQPKKSKAGHKKPGAKPGLKNSVELTSNEPITAVTSASTKTVLASKPKPVSPKADVENVSPPKKKTKTVQSLAGELTAKSPNSPNSPSLNSTTKAEVKKLLKVESEKKAAMEKAYQKLVDMIKGMSEDDLPRRKISDKVTVKVPSDRKAGDTIMFQNPHVKGQRLRVKIPKTAVPGGTFKVTVPVPKSAPEDEDEDHNTWSREFYEVMSEYGYCYDALMDAIQERQAAQGLEFPAHFEKRKKFDNLVDEFPNKHLKTPIDKAYLQKILRRARQNKHKRDKTAKRLEEMAQRFIPEKGPGHEDGRKVDDDSDEDRSENSSKRRAVQLPIFSKKFPRVPFLEEDF